MIPDPLLGQILAGFHIEARIGQGGMSRVYRAVQPSVGRAVALKVLAPELSENEEFRSRFLTEATRAAAIEHPNILPVYDAGEDHGQLFIAMRLVDGSDLRALLERGGRLAPERALAIVAQVAAALDAAHARGLIHRDVKPGNVLLTADDHVYLADFGVAKSALARRELTRTGVFVGTLDYAAPEQIRNEPLSAATDLYALGCVLYQCLTGQVPFDRSSEFLVMQAHLTDPPPKPSEYGLPTALDAVIATAIAKAPDERYRSGRRLVDAARAVLSGAAPAAAQPTMLATVSRLAATRVSTTESATAEERKVTSAQARRVSPGLLAAVALAIVVAAGGIVAFANSNSQSGAAVPSGGPTAPPVTAPPVTAPPVTAPPSPRPNSPFILSLGCNTSVQTNQVVSCSPSISGTVSNYSWSASSGSSPSGGTNAGFSTTFARAGTFIITLRVSNIGGSDTEQQVISVTAP
jgi:serine/threonine protein kinase